MTAGSTARSLLKQLPKLLRGSRREFFAALQAPIPLLGGFFERGHLLRGGAVLTLGVVRRFNVDFAQRDDVRAANNADVFAPRRGREPPSEILLSIGNRQSFHIIFI